MPKVPVQPLFAQHRDECGQQRHEKACVQKVQGYDDLLGRTIPGRREGGIFVRSDGWVEAEEDCAEVGLRLFVGIRLEVGLDVDDEGGADGGEQTGLRTWSTLYIDEGARKPTKIKVVFRSSLCFCMYSASYSIVSRLYIV